MRIVNGLVFRPDGTWDKAQILCENGRIKSLLPQEAEKEEKESGGFGKGKSTRTRWYEKAGETYFDASGCYVLPGLTDIHLHGAVGHDLCEALTDVRGGGDKTGEGKQKERISDIRKRTLQAISAIAEFEYSQGVTQMIPCTMTFPADELTQVLKACAAYASQADAADRAELTGIHLEGPFLSEKKKGAQKREFLQKPDAVKIRDWQEAAGGLLKLMTIAPELEGAMECIRKFAKDIHFSIGHTEADYETAARAFLAGADHVTHLYNAMPPFGHRKPGVIGAAFEAEQCFAELICDGVHVAPSAVRAAFTLFGDDRIVLISDSMEACGMPDGEYQLGGQKVLVKGKLATLEDGTIAGSASSLYQCMKKAVSMGIPLESAIKAVTINPCLAVGLEKEFGSIEAGKKARFLILDQRLDIVEVIKEAEGQINARKRDCPARTGCVRMEGLLS